MFVAGVDCEPWFVLLVEYLIIWSQSINDVQKKGNNVQYSILRELVKLLSQH